MAAPPAKATRLRPLAERASSPGIPPLSRYLLRLIVLKQSNLCVSADVHSTKQLLALAEEVGDYICVLKTHADIIDDFSDRTIRGLQDISRRKGFLLFEDRKFGDIGNTLQSQYTHGPLRIAQWAHITNAHLLPGPSVVPSLRSAALETLAYINRSVATTITSGSLQDEFPEHADDTDHRRRSGLSSSGINVAKQRASTGAAIGRAIADASKAGDGARRGSAVAPGEDSLPGSVGLYRQQSIDSAEGVVMFEHKTSRTNSMGQYSTTTTVSQSYEPSLHNGGGDNSLHHQSSNQSGSSAQSDHDTSTSLNAATQTSPPPASSQQTRAPPPPPLQSFNNGLVSPTTITSPGLQQTHNDAATPATPSYPPNIVTENLGPPPHTSQRGLLLLAQMSSAGTLTSLPGYTQQCIETARNHKDFVLGYICQEDLNGGLSVARHNGASSAPANGSAAYADSHDEFISMTPGVSLPPASDTTPTTKSFTKTDGKGQQYRTPHAAVVESGADIIIVGRGIISADDRRAEAERYRAAGWAALVERTGES